MSDQACPSPSPSVPPSGRDASGRFTAGNAGGPGNPFARQVAALRQAMLDAVTPDLIQAIVQAVSDKARMGDLGAAKLLLQYALGKPAQAVQPDRLDVEEWQHFRETAGLMSELPELANKPEPEVPLTVLRLGRLAASCKWDGFIHNALLPDEPPSANGGNGARVPSTNGGNGARAPSTNGGNGARTPSTNGGNGQAIQSDRLARLRQKARRGKSKKHRRQTAVNG